MLLCVGVPLTIGSKELRSLTVTYRCKFIDRSLKTTGTSNKVRVTHRITYSAAPAYTTTPSTDGGRVKSENFRILRGVL